MTLDVQRVEDLSAAARQVRRQVGRCYSAKLRSLAANGTQAAQDAAALAWEKTPEGQAYKAASGRAFRAAALIEQKLSAYRDTGALRRWWYQSENASWANRLARELSDATRAVESATGCTVRVVTPQFGDVGLADWLTGGQSTKILLIGAGVVLVLLLVKT